MDYATAQTVFANLEAGTFVGIDTLVDVKLKGGKSNPQQGLVTKAVTGATVMCFANKQSNAYENMVKRRLEQEGKSASDFELSPRKWGERVKGTPFVAHKDKMYLEVIYLHAGATEYRVSGVATPAAQINGLPEATSGGQGGLDNTVIIRTYALDSIAALRVNGKEYK